MSASADHFVGLATRYLAERRALGFALTIAGRQLLAFARYADAHATGGRLTIPLAVEWARLAPRPSPVTWVRRLEVVRPFARFLRQFDPTSEIPPTGLLGRAHRRLAPYVYNTSDLRDLLEGSRRLSPAGRARADTVATVFALLACTGLRVSEALRLHREDVDLATGVLHIRQTKFGKSRLVPLHPSAVLALQQYATRRDRQVPRALGPAFFVVDGGLALSYSKLRTAFRRVRLRRGWPSARAQGPRIHGLRHTFACRRLLEWHRAGVEVEAHLLDLSTYLGHAKVSDTYWYLSGFPELLALVGQRFEGFAVDGAEARS
jgi:integrase